MPPLWTFVKVLPLQVHESIPSSSHMHVPSVSHAGAHGNTTTQFVTQADFLFLASGHVIITKT